MNTVKHIRYHRSSFIYGKILDQLDFVYPGS